MKFGVELCLSLLSVICYCWGEGLTFIDGYQVVWDTRSCWVRKYKKVGVFVFY